MDIDDTNVAQGEYPNYEDDEVIFEKFLREHEILSTNPESRERNLQEPGMNGVYRINAYGGLLQRIKNRHYYDDARVFTVEVPLDELVKWESTRGAEIANRAMRNTLRYQALFSKVIDDVLETMEVTDTTYSRDSTDILNDQRLAQQARLRAQAEQQENGGEEGEGQALNSSAADGVSSEFPPILMRRYELRILPLGRSGVHPPFKFQHQVSRSVEYSEDGKPVKKSLDGVSLRHIRSQAMGTLVTIKGMIVRASDVKPCCTVAAYTCDKCGFEIFQVVQNKREFMPQRLCPTSVCRNNKNTTDSLHIQTRGSRFEKFQELKIQELPNQVPMGHVPRSMTVHCRGEITRMAAPGDEVTIDGIFLPQRVAEAGYRAMQAGLISTTFLEAQHIHVHKKSYDESMADSLQIDERAKLDEEIMNIATGEDPVGKLASSIAPEIWGHEDIKRALLLQLVGGCTRKLPDGMRIRGDINICLMGDPGVAKSQMLKHVSTITPRGVYTTGKGSSGVGLTAAITKDLTTGEMALEGGALVLSDQGICCIDEFDKMDEADRTAIHEVMEQQTVSVAKAGIVATLNARAAVLAAANPLYGRYNRKKSLSENVNLPNSLLSRFDLMFLILDIADVDKDMALARHVTFVHQNEGLKSKGDLMDESDDSDSDSEEDEVPEVTETKPQHVPPETVREYISRARKFQPVIPPDVAPYIVEAYVGLRMQIAPGQNSRRNVSGDQTVMTARQLLSILRLSQALARLRFSDLVAREDVDEAIRLTHMSKASLIDDNQVGQEGMKQDVTSRVFGILKDYATVSRAKRLELKLCEAMVLRKGFTMQQLKTCLEEYQALDIIQLNATGTHIDFI